MTMSLRTKLIATSFGMLVLLFGICLYQFRDAQFHERESLVSGFEIHAHALEESIAAQFFERYGDVQAFARNTVFYSGDANSMTWAMNEYAKLYGLYDVILFVDTQGRYIASNTMAPDGKPINWAALRANNYAAEGWFKAALAEKFTEDATRGFVGTYVEDPGFDQVIAAAYGETRYANSFTTIVKDRSGKALGVMTNRANFKWAEAEAVRAFGEMKETGLSDVVLTLLGKTGTLLIDYSPIRNNGSTDVTHDAKVIGVLNLAGKSAYVDNLLARKAGTAFEKDWRLGVDVVSAFAPMDSAKFIPSLGWGIGVSTPTAALFATINRAETQYYISCVLTLIACLLLVAWQSTRIANSISRLVGEVKEAGAQVNVASGQLSGATQQVSSSSTEAASSLEETVSSVEELSSMVKLNADNSKQAASLSQTSSRSAEEGESEIRKLIESMREIAQSSKKIEEIINVIDDIAFQTNLLALNAAVEAARAGEQGKGFAVVAEAVRNLAQRSASAAKDINGLIKESVQRIERGTGIADSSGSVLKNIVASIKKVSDLNNEIAAASGEQASGISQISKAMNSLDSTTQQNAAASEEMAASAAEMSSQATKLEELVGELNGVLQGTAAALHRSAPSGSGSGTSGGGDQIHRRASSPPKATQAPRKLVAIPGGKRTAQEAIPFDEHEEPQAKLGTTDGF